ncbi:MAG: hypothetical protein ACH255_16610 [Candidatus Thiodiazotropha sp.]
MHSTKTMTTVLLLSIAMLLPLSALAKERTTGRGTGPVIFVTSLGLYFDSIVVADPLPMQGPFQQLIPGMNGLETEFGPGQPGHLGGRWWVDLNDDGIMDSGDHFFLCPLLGPGRDHL